MDIPTILVIFVAGLLAIGVTAYMLNRAWGDFPSRAGPLSGAPPSTTPARAPAPADDEGDRFDENRPDAALPAGAPEGGVVPITQPVVRRAIMTALERGGSPYATYFLRDGDRVFLAAYRIADPVERDQMTRMFQGLNANDVDNLDFREVAQVLKKIAGR